MSKETVEEKKTRLETLKELRDWSIEAGDKHSLAEAKAEIKKVEAEIKIKEAEDDVDARVTGTGYKLIEGDPELAAGPRVFFGRKSRDTKLSIGDLSGTKQGESPKEGEAD